MNTQDPSSRAWITTIIRGGGGGRESGLGRPRSRTGASSINEEEGLSESVWGEGSGRERAFSNTTFLVCVHNVSPAQPYAILRAPVNATAADIVVQVLHKARRCDDPQDLVLLEELGLPPDPSPPPKTSVSSALDSPSLNLRSWRHKASSLLLSSPLRDRSPSTASGRSARSARSEGQAPAPATAPASRVVADGENVYALQSAWKASGRFLLASRPQAQAALDAPSPKPRKRSLVPMRSLNFGRNKATSSSK